MPEQKKKKAPKKPKPEKKRPEEEEEEDKEEEERDKDLEEALGGDDIGDILDDLRKGSQEQFPEEYPQKTGQ